MNQEQCVEYVEKKLKKIINHSIQKKRYEKAMSAIASCAQLFYIWNQKYVDYQLEMYSNDISDKLVEVTILKSNVKSDTILFYDGFGFDTRGLAIIYLKAFAELGYKIVYLVPNRCKNQQKELKNILEKFDVTWIYYSTSRYKKRLKIINNTFNVFKPKNAFFYSTPDDVAGASVFFAYKDIVTRFQINLTDHAYWLGTTIFDFCIEFRDYGASISYYYRGIPRKKLIKLPYYPYYNKETVFEGFPFKSENKKIIFSGGSLYKTLGDSNNTYYKILEQLLMLHPDVIFLYAGSGDCTELNKIAKKFPHKVYHISERKDLYQVMRHCTFYLNTYPMLGCLMTQYAVVAGKVPLTLIRKDDVAEGILIEQEKRCIEYFDAKSLVEDANRLLTDKAYLNNREQLLVGAVISSTEFKDVIQSIIKRNNSKYVISYKRYNTESFLQEYKNRFNAVDAMLSSVARKNNKILFFDFPWCFMKKVLRKSIKFIKGENSSCK